MDPFAVFLAALAFFHCSEFCLAAAFNPEELGWQSWLISKPYCTAMFAACLEYVVEVRWAPFLKLAPLSYAGLAALVGGELVRKAAMLTAGPHFTHLIQTRRRPQHTLVMRGVYRWVRHPGYAGWMVWAVGTQLLLCNPLCAAGFAAAAWRFFRGRIEYEDRLLANFFGDEFEQYKAAVPSGIPGVP